MGDTEGTESESETQLFTDLGWDKASPQQEGRDKEKPELKLLGGRQHPNSGAGRIKYDGSNDEELIEIKTANRSYSLRASFVKDLYTCAIRQSKEAVLVVRFPDYRVVCRIERIT